MIPEVGNLAHPAQPHIRARGNQAGANRAIVGFLLCVAAEHVTESFHEPTLSVGEMEHTAMSIWGSASKKGWLTGSLSRGYQVQRTLGRVFDLKVDIFSRSDTLIDLNKTIFKALFKLG